MYTEDIKLHDFKACSGNGELVFMVVAACRNGNVVKFGITESSPFLHIPKGYCCRVTYETSYYDSTLDIFYIINVELVKILGSVNKS
jgi:hypothetical protein